MKKEYVKPMIQVYEMRVQGQLLNYSNAGLGAPEFNPEGGFDWVEKGYQFGGWELEEE